MKRLLGLVGVLLAAAAPVAASSSESARCWTATAFHPGDGRPEVVTECRMEGSGSTEVFGSVGEVPWRLSPAVGTGADGAECWFWTSVRGETAALPDPLWPARELAACVGEPARPVGPSAAEEAYGLLSSYTHPSPVPVLDPLAGRGLAGLETFLTVPVPEPWSATLVSPLTGRTITVQTRVVGVVVEWGDGTSEPLAVSGEVAEGTHVFEAKTCAEPAPRCGLVAADGYPLTVRFRWEAGFDADGAGWAPLTVPDTATTVPYPVVEIIGILTG